MWEIDNSTGLQIFGWFGAPSRGVFCGMPAVVVAIGRFLTGSNNNSRPFA